MTDPVEAKYLQENRHVAERLMIRLSRPRLLRDRASDEDYVDCRKSADTLRKVLEVEMLLIKDGGFLLRALMEMQKACTNFVSAAGRKSENFKQDDDLFRYHLATLRAVFAQRLEMIVDRFDLQVWPEIERIIAFRP